MKRLLGFLAGLSLIGVLFSPLPAIAWTHGSAGSPATCPYSIDNGCAAAPANGSFKNASLLTTAQSDGQNSLLPTHPMQFNIPGVDYALGPDKTLTPQDPRTISDSVCAYSATGNSGTPWVFCASTAFVNEVLNNYDFCGTKIGQTPVPLFVAGIGQNHPILGSTFSVTNSYFCLQTASTSLSGNFNYGTFGGIGGGQNWNIIFDNNQCDGTGALSSDPFCIGESGTDTTGTGIDIEYNAFTNQGVGRVAAGMRDKNFTLKYNFIQGLNDASTSNHGEVMLRTCSQTGCTAFDDYESNFIIWNPPSTAGLNNATFFPGDGASHGISLTFTKVINNVIVTNQNGSSQTVIDQSLFNARLATLGDLTITGNWVSALGANSCSISGAKSGGNSVTASTTTNTLNVTATSSSFGNNPIEPGWLILHSGFTTTPITAYGTGTGNLGTYTFGGAPQTLGSDSAWTLVPGYTSETFSDNWNLGDPSHTGIPQAMGISGPQVIASVCVT